MKTLMALLLLATAAAAQDKPPPREGDQTRPPGANPRPRDGDPRPPGAPRDGDPPRREGDRPGQPPPPREGGRRPVPPFNPEEVRLWLAANEPETSRRVDRMQQENRREEAHQVLADASVRMREMNDLKARDPKGYERVAELRRLEREGNELAEQARRAPPEDKEAASKKLQENLGKQFDLREDQRVREIGELKRRVEALEKALTDRKAGKDKIVDKRRRELLGEKVDEDW